MNDWRALAGYAVAGGAVVALAALRALDWIDTHRRRS